MTLPAFATIDDLSDRLPGGVSDADSARAQAALADASALIRSATNTTWCEGDPATLVGDLPDIVITVTCRAALRAFTNPDGVTQDTTGPFSTSYANASSDVYLTRSEISLVRQAAGKVGLGVIEVTRGCIETPSVICGSEGVADEYVDVEPAGTPIPYR